MLVLRSPVRFGSARPRSAILAAGLSWCQKQQFFPQQVQIHQRAHREQLGGILLQSAIAQLHKPEGKRYLTRVLDSLDSAFADFDSETATLDLPHMQNRKPEAIKRYLEFRLQQIKMLLDTVEDYVAEEYPATGGHS